MAIIKMKKSKRGTSIHMKAGKGENLRDLVFALAGKTPEQPRRPLRQEDVDPDPFNGAYDDAGPATENN